MEKNVYLVHGIHNAVVDKVANAAELYVALNDELLGAFLELLTPLLEVSLLLQQLRGVLLGLSRDESRMVRERKPGLVEFLLRDHARLPQFRQQPAVSLYLPSSLP
jgi:hypothetical protein